MKLYEYCDNCNKEITITKFGGYCKECNKFIKPCSLCNNNICNCNECKFTNNIAKNKQLLINVKKKLKLLLRECNVKQQDLYYYTGFHFKDIITIEDYNEIVRLLSNTYCNLEKYYI